MMEFSQSGSASKTNVSSFTAFGSVGFGLSSEGTFLSARCHGRPKPSWLSESTKSTAMRWIAIEPALKTSEPSSLVCWASSSGRSEYSMMVILSSTRQKLPSFSLAYALGSILDDIWQLSSAWSPMKSGSIALTSGLSICVYEICVMPRVFMSAIAPDVCSALRDPPCPLGESASESFACSSARPLAGSMAGIIACGKHVTFCGSRPK